MTHLLRTLVVVPWLAALGAGAPDRSFDTRFATRSGPTAISGGADSLRWENPCGTAVGRLAIVTRDPDGLPTFRVVDGNHCVEVRATGPVDLDADAEVRRLPGSGVLLVQEARDGRTRRMAVTARAGRIERSYAVDGAPRPAAEGAEWLRRALRRVTDAGLGAGTLRRPGER